MKLFLILNFQNLVIIKYQNSILLIIIYQVKWGICLNYKVTYTKLVKTIFLR